MSSEAESWNYVHFHVLMPSMSRAQNYFVREFG